DLHKRREKVLMKAKQADTSSRQFAAVSILLQNISQAVKGEPLTSVSKLLQSFVAERDSHLVERMRKEGFLFAGHTNTPEFALKNITEPKSDGPARNPWNTDFSPGGSSGGS